MDPAHFRELVRTAAEDDVAAAIASLQADEGLTFTNAPVELLELYNRIIDIVTGERAIADLTDDERVAAARAAELRGPKLPGH
jgi:hypothetical protein